MRTGGGPAVQANYRAPVGGLAAIGDAISGFFGTAARTLETVDEIDHRVQVVKTQRENDALQLQASADAQAGVAPDPGKLDRFSYLGTYDRATAVNIADKTVQGIAKRAAQLKTDGSESIEPVIQEMVAAEFGKGTGRPEFDEAFLSQVRRKTDQLAYGFNEQVRQTQRANLRTNYVASLAVEMKDGTLFREGRLAELVTEATSLHDGDAERGRAFFAQTLAAPITSEAEAVGVLKAFTTSFTPDGKTLADAYPDLYLKVDREALGRIASSQTLEGREAWASLDANIDADMASGALTLQSLRGHAQQALLNRRKLGGLGEFDRMLNKIAGIRMDLAKKQAGANLFSAVLESNMAGGNVRLSEAAAANGVEVTQVMTKMFDTGIADFVTTRADATPNLAKTAQGGVLRPLATPEASFEFGRLTSDPRFVRSVDGGWSNTYRSTYAQAITGADPASAVNAFRGYAAYERGAGLEHALRLMPEDARRLYLGARSYAAMGRPVEGFFQTRLDNRELADTLIEGAAKHGSYEWPKLLEDPRLNRGETEAKVDRGVLDAVRDAMGYSGKVHAANDDDMNALRAEVVQALVLQRQAGGKPDLDSAVKSVADLVRGRFSIVPGRDGNGIVRRDPFGGAGLQLDHPVSAPGPDGPRRVVYNGQPAYGAGIVKNALGEDEDTRKTARDEDFPALAWRFPGKVAGGAQMSLGAPLAAGMLQVQASDNRPIIFAPGETFTGRMPRDPQGFERDDPSKAAFGIYPQAKRSGPVTRSGVTEKFVVPADTTEARKFLADRLPPGFHVVDMSIAGQTVFTLGYTHRVKVGHAEAAARRAQSQADYEKAADHLREFDARRKAERQTVDDAIEGVGRLSRELAQPRE